ncbi:MAG: bifunctional oligoribonuclease/PAP phosphatase NrnA [Acidobacteriaceae bacterium]
MTEPSTTERRTPAIPIGNVGRMETLTCDTAQGSVTEVLDAIRQRERFLLTSHARPDGDAVGSLIALWMTLTAMGKQAEMQLFDPVPVIYGTLPAADQIRQFAGPMVGFEPDAVIFLECDSVERSRLEGLDDKFLINIDHHTSGTPFAHVNWIDTKASAVAELVYRLAVAAKVKVTPAMATCIYTALLSDTGSFCYEGTGANTFALAKDLVDMGATPARIAEDLYFSNPLSKMRLLGAALTTLQRDGSVAWLWITHDDMVRLGASDEDALGIVNYAIGIAGVEVAVFLREMADRRIRVSLRSKSTVRVTHVAEQFGGGGHENASGCNLDGPMDVAIERILTEVRRHLRPHVVVDLT